MKILILNLILLKLKLMNNKLNKLKLKKNQKEIHHNYYNKYN